MVSALLGEQDACQPRDARIGPATIERLRAAWQRTPGSEADALLERALGTERARALDRFDAVQLADVLRACQEAKSLSDAGRALFAVSRSRRSKTNDADRLRKYLLRFGLSLADLEALRGERAPE